MGTRWTDGQKLQVLVAVDSDHKAIGKSGRDNLGCPICGKATLAYRRTGFAAMTSWCSTCETGIKQGSGASEN